MTTGNPNCNYDLFYCASGDANCGHDGNENTCPSNSHRKLIRYVDTPPSGCITLHEASAKNELIFKTNLFANIKARVFQVKVHRNHCVLRLDTVGSKLSHGNPLIYRESFKIEPTCIGEKS